jgi:maltooligosyltrehalose trehalohydrolase
MDPGLECAWSLEWGACTLPGGGVRFRVWAPIADSLSIKLEGPAGRTVGMERRDEDIFEVTVGETGPGTDYRFVFSDGCERPDPFSRWQPRGVHGTSRVVDPAAFPWGDQQWTGISLDEHVLYELHVGAFTPEGTFEAVIPRLPRLRELGVTAIQLMPVAEFPGSRNWGYDGVSLFAPHSAYGGPDGLKRLVDACHREGLAIHLDVVYNHLGPEGSYIGDFGPYLNPKHNTGWGPAFNVDGPGAARARRFILDNALYWQTEFHIDGLRLDAVHSFEDTSERHILAEIAETAHRQEQHTGRLCWIIAESDLNDPKLIYESNQGGFGLDSQWSNDFHHALHATLLGSRHGYFGDFGSLEQLATALTHGFVYQGQYSAFRGREHGKPPVGVDGHRFVIFIQNHDQVANSYHGDRLAALATLAQQRLAAAILLCAPSLPLLFMGEEYGEAAPFFFFTSHGDPEVIERTRRGRREEHAYADPDGIAPDPQELETFRRSKLEWGLAERGDHREMFALYRDLLALRRGHPALTDFRREAASVWHHEERCWLILHRGQPGGEGVLLIANFADIPGEIIPPALEGSWRLELCTADPRYGGPPQTGSPPRTLSTGTGAAEAVRLAAHSAAIYLRTETLQV